MFYVTKEVVADSFQLLKAAAREGHAAGGYSSCNGGFAGAGPKAFVDLNQAMQRQTLVVKKIHLVANPMDISDDDLPF